MAIVPRMPADFVSLSARMLTPPRRAIASASWVEQQDSSAITGTVTARDLGHAFAVPARDRLLDEVQVVGLEARMAWSAVARSQPWFASTQEMVGPTASRSRRTRSTSWANGCAAVLILKMRWPRATFSRASLTSASALSTASDHDRGTRSRTRPPSRRCTGTPSARPFRSQSAISTAARANGLPRTRFAISRLSASIEVASRPTSHGAM